MSRKHDIPDDEIHSEENEVSKSQVKREFKALQALGEKIVNLSESQRKKIPMDEAVEEAVSLAARLQGKKHIAYRRQIQYIGKLFRVRDMQPIEQAVARLEQQSLSENAHFHALEKMRDTLIEQGNDGINTLIGRFHTLDRQKLRQLVKTAQKEQEQGKPPAAARKIFRYLREFLPEDFQ